MFGTSVLAMALTFFCTAPTFANAATIDRDSFNSATETSLKEQLSEVAKEKNLNVIIDNISVDAPQSTIDEYHGDAHSYAADIVKAYESDTGTPATEIPVIKNSGMSTLGTAKYTSSVFSGVPAGGVCWVKQDFRATVTNYRVTSKSLLGKSYQTGFCAFQWSPNYSWFEGNLNVLSKGTFHAIIKGGPISFSATFKALFHANKSSLHQEFQ